VFGLGIGAGHQHRLVSGPVSELAAAQAQVAVELVTGSDPQLHPATGPRPPFLTLRAIVHAVEGRGSAWRVRSPVLVTVSGAQVSQWSTLLVGTRVSTQARLQTPTPGSDVAAVLRARGPVRVTAPPSPALRLVERVREGLRESVRARPVEPRALVPALVLGDTSAMTPDITEDFQVTGLTHLTAVSGANLTLLLAFLLLLARWVGVRGWWLRVPY
jgi:competence protein ComEC